MTIHSGATDDPHRIDDIDVEAYRSGVYTMRGTADYFRVLCMVHHETVGKIRSLL
jgi:hypothetical protein